MCGYGMKLWTMKCKCLCVQFWEVFFKGEGMSLSNSFFIRASCNADAISETVAATLNHEVTLQQKPHSRTQE